MSWSVPSTICAVITTTTGSDMRSPATRVVFDCPIYAQALINPKGPAAACLTLAQTGLLSLYISDYVLQEIYELSSKLKPRLGVTADRVQRLIHDLAKYARPLDTVPAAYTHPLDPDDSHYVNLAIATNSQFIISRDQHLLDLMDNTQAMGQDFQARYPTIQVIDPATFLEYVRSQKRG